MMQGGAWKFDPSTTIRHARDKKVLIYYLPPHQIWWQISWTNRVYWNSSELASTINNMSIEVLVLWNPYSVIDGVQK